MRTRNGFVSNSSSSSFVVAFNPRNDRVNFLFTTLEMAVDPGDGDPDSEMSIHDTAEEAVMKTYDLSEYGEGEAPYRILEDAKSVPGGFRFALISADYSDGTLNGILDVIRKDESGDMIIISDGG